MSYPRISGGSWATTLPGFPAVVRSMSGTIPLMNRYL